MRIFPLGATPRVRVVAAPPFPVSALAETAAAGIRVGALDSPKLLVLAADAHTITVYESTYSVRLAHHALAEEGVSPLGLGSLGVWLILRNLAGEILLAKRSDAVMIEPGRWSPAVIGGVDPGETPDEAVLREAQEELGLLPADMADLHPLALCVGEEPVGCAVLYGASIREDARPRLDASEATELRWVAAPALPAAISHLLDLVADAGTTQGASGQVRS